MYVQMKKLAAMGLVLLLPTLLLSACGGASSEDGSVASPSSTANKPDVSSSATSLTGVSSISPSSVTSPTNSSIPSSSPRSSIESSSVQSYSRVSRASNSSTSEDTSGNRDAINPEPTSLQLHRLSETSITLIWDDAIDNVGINHYKISRNGKVVVTADISSHIFVDQDLSPNTDYEYAITAVDFSGNSATSPVLPVRTLTNSHGDTSSASSTSSISSSSSSTSTNSNSSTSSSTSSKSSSTQQIITITWNHPTTREDGVFLDPDEIGGYEIRYRRSTESRYTYIVLNSNRVNTYTHRGEKNTEFEIAAFDANGVYGQFTKIDP